MGGQMGGLKRRLPRGKPGAKWEKTGETLRGAPHTKKGAEKAGEEKPGGGGKKTA